MWMAHVRSFVARHRAVYWGAVAALALVVALVLIAQSRQLSRARSAWGTPVEVWVAARDLAPGEPIAAERRSVPAAVAPAAALVGALPEAPLARQHVTAGEVLVERDLATSRLPLLTGDRRAVSVPVDEASLAVEVGDRVDVVSAGVVIATDGVVAATGTASVTVGVATSHAAAVATAAADRTAVLVMRPEG
jgi:hypothetical protein